MKKLIIILLLPFVAQSMQQPKSLEELALINTDLLKTIEATSWVLIQEDDALYKKNLVTIEKLLELGADPNYVDPNIHLPLIHHAALCTKPFLEWHLSSNEKDMRNEVIKLLLSHGAHPDLTTRPMVIPYLWAAKKNIHILNLFLEFGANPNQVCPGKAKTHKTLLFNLCGYTSGEPVEVAKTLIQYGADPLYPRPKDNTQVTALTEVKRWDNTHLIPLYEKGGLQKIP